MRIQDLEDLFVNELEEAYDFEQQIAAALPEMAESAHHPGLRKRFRRQLEQTRLQVQQLEEIFDGLGVEPARRTCKGMQGLLSEGHETATAGGGNAVVDAALIGAAQRVEHYEMAAYATLRSFARTLGRDEEAAALQEILEQEAQMDRHLSRLAERRLHARAVDGLSASKRAGRSRTRRSGRRGSSVRTRVSASNGQTKVQLYEQARELDIEGRSTMNKRELQRAIGRGDRA